MNSNKITGRAKHRQAFGHDSVSRLVKLDLERQSNKKKAKPAKNKTYDSISELFKYK